MGSGQVNVADDQAGADALQNFVATVQLILAHCIRTSLRRIEQASQAS
ncbi:MAG: hypothetical protein JWQ17_2594 [Tardiphaga sp.]|jgi:hypothetical protein|nr:hypothetical protein [Tardiphaga sp.]